ncbi:hypothetical protein BpHYR1_039176 [Brachionus plicatilis]|uniref:Uncharacterized protein n=1 Tax=Brachionus plicatilis TaxID=10195 RepID=A0A3M7QP04_BRAPC|nr:hypothetical protein BpHYR1_039176 [Brachionus plicatilis]
MYSMVCDMMIMIIKEQIKHLKDKDLSREGIWVFCIVKTFLEIGILIIKIFLVFEDSILVEFLCVDSFGKKKSFMFKPNIVDTKISLSLNTCLIRLFWRILSYILLLKTSFEFLDTFKCSNGTRNDKD